MPFYSSRARFNPDWPERVSECQRCGEVYTLADLSPQYRWGGMQLFNTNTYVCQRCMDVPNPQERAIILPPDPPPTFLARPVSFPSAENDYRTTESGIIRTDETGTVTRVPEGN